MDVDNVRQLALDRISTKEFKSQTFLEANYESLCNVLEPEEIGSLSVAFRGLRMHVGGIYRAQIRDWKLSEAQANHFIEHMTGMMYMETKGIIYTYDRSNFQYLITGRDKNRAAYADEQSLPAEV